MDQKEFDVLIIGAGAAGLIAALEITLTGRTVAIIEAKGRCGGRILTGYTQQGYPIEMGAEFVHGNLPITQQMVKQIAAETIEINGSIWQKKEGDFQEQEDFIEDYKDLENKFTSLEKDIPVSSFIDEYLKDDQYEELRFTLQNYVEGYYAADTRKASTYALREELTKADEEQYRIEGGYQVVIDHLERQCREKGVQFFLSQPVWQLHWKKGHVTAITEKGSFSGKKGLVTVSIGVLQHEGITFSPQLPQVKEAANQLGFGHVIKIVVHFEDAFWKDQSLTNHKDLQDLTFLFSEEMIPTWWTQYPKKQAVITGWIGGPKAEALQLLSNEELINKAIYSLSRLFNTDVLHLQQKRQQVYLYNWSADPFSLGAYSYEVVGGKKAIDTLKQPIENTLYFAGEGLYQGPEIGTVEAALNSGRTSAHLLIAQF
jgi:monoamine oxidase